MPKGLYTQAKVEAKKFHYNSVSEFIRDATRKLLYPRLTVNGFTPQFESMVLRREKQSTKNDIVWEGKESDLANYDKSPKKPRIYSRSKRVASRTTRFDGRDRFAGAMV